MRSTVSGRCRVRRAPCSTSRLFPRRSTVKVEKELSIILSLATVSLRFLRLSRLCHTRRLSPGHQSVSLLQEVLKESHQGVRSVVVLGCESDDMNG
ncbi:hypothetical protein E2C01_010649 [Portunus trituberculatus]|uniref:Uncharacterized protein n=1 Tax=Portunus trituberculatus TaxID=210409 RepID=A0A5B7D981_PORTR|nr:hypothetical protein [Portunus trituberculatus]